MSDYYFLISSLPSLKFDETPFLSVKSFLDLCSGHLSQGNMKILHDLALIPPAKNTGKKAPPVEKWYQWETYLRDRLAKFRAENLGRVAREFIRQQGESVHFDDIDRAVNEQLILADPFEREKTLDGLRWRKLDEMEFGKHFDFDFLCSYKLKLMIREKWIRRDMEKGLLNLNEIVDRCHPKKVHA